MKSGMGDATVYAQNSLKTALKQNSDLPRKIDTFSSPRHFNSSAAALQIPGPHAFPHVSYFYDFARTGVRKPEWINDPSEPESPMLENSRSSTGNKASRRSGQQWDAQFLQRRL